jgi:hypothetical protein
MLTRKLQRARATNGAWLRRRTELIRDALAALLFVGLLTVSSAAGLFGELVVFGDSLSDMGNVEQATASFPFVPTTPGRYYYNGRFSKRSYVCGDVCERIGFAAADP